MVHPEVSAAKEPWRQSVIMGAARGGDTRSAWLADVARRNGRPRSLIATNKE